MCILQESWINDARTGRIIVAPFQQYLQELRLPPPTISVVCPGSIIRPIPTTARQTLLISAPVNAQGVILQCPGIAEQIKHFAIIHQRRDR